MTATVQLPAIGVGTGLGLARDGVSDAERVRRLQLAMDLGLRLVDTAPAYDEGEAEALVGRAVRGRRDDVVVATKFGPEDSTRDAVVRSAEASLRRLGTDRIDLLQMHWPNPRVPLADTLEGMMRLVEEGKVRWLGLGNCTASHLRRAQCAAAALPLISVQQEYSLVERGVEDAIVPFCSARGLALLAYSPLAQGRMTPDDGGALSDVARRRQATPAQVALAWLRRHRHVIPIPKAASEHHLRENAAAVGLVLDARDVAQIDAAYARRTVRVPTTDIDVAPAGARDVYRSLAEALENRLGLVPAPADLAVEVAEGELLKPVKLRAGDAGGRRWQLVDGRVRFWAWVIAHGPATPIPAVVAGQESDG